MVFLKRPALPKMFDIVLQYLELHYQHDELTLKELSYRLVMLLAILLRTAVSDFTLFICVFNEDE